MEYIIYGIIAIQILQAIAYFQFRNDTLRIAKKIACCQFNMLKDIVKLETKENENEKE